MQTLHTIRSARLATCVLTILLSACGGGHHDTPQVPTASKLTYVAEKTASSADWRVVVDTTTNNKKKVVLKILGPTGLKVRGATFFLSSDAAKCSWSQPSGTTGPLFKAGSALSLTQGPNSAVQLFKSELSDSKSDLQMAIYQKTGYKTLTGAKDLGSVALTLKANTSPGPVHLRSTAGLSAVYVDAYRKEHSITLKIGTLTAK